LIRPSPLVRSTNWWRLAGSKLCDFQCGDALQMFNLRQHLLQAQGFRAEIQTSFAGATWDEYLSSLK